MFHVGHMYPYLMGATAFQLAADVGMRCEALHQAIMRYRRLPGRHDRHFLAFTRVATNRCVHRRTTGEGANHNGFVFPPHGPGLQLIDQRCVGNQTTRHHHDAGRVFVETVHNACSRQVLHFRGMVEQGIDQGAVSVARRRVDHQACGLVDDQQVLVLVHNIQVYRFCFPTDLRFRFRVQVKPIAQHYLVPGLTGFSIDRQRAALDPALQSGARVLRHQLGCGLIQAAVAVLRWNGEAGDNTVFR